MITVRLNGMVLRYRNGMEVKRANDGPLVAWDIKDANDDWLATVPASAIIESSNAQLEVTEQREIFE